ncbi:hypothetical protein B0H17DRAFT_1136152 [Mycena rosella]|uniref:Uncharacterized protein n=1 Tax=Mycena rosella TaxID=1033263 RepID=A0AAD7GGX7_MYCRO|nr:hypothetical protein B0H17DRAFT_1136152 [Mycena rosella]
MRVRVNSVLAQVACYTTPGAGWPSLQITTPAVLFQVHRCGATEEIIGALPAGAKRDGALFPDGTHLTNPTEIRELSYTMQRPAIAPSVGERSCAITIPRPRYPSQYYGRVRSGLRAFHECNLAAPDERAAPTSEDVNTWA